MDRFDAKSAVVVVLLIIVSIGALAEVVGGRAVTPPEPPRPASWQILVQAGDAARVRGDVPAARRAYLGALFRARGERSTTGVLRAAEGFKVLGDAKVVENALRIAVALGGEPGRDTDRLQALRDRLDAAAAMPMDVHAPR